MMKRFNLILPVALIVGAMTGCGGGKPTAPAVNTLSAPDLILKVGEERIISLAPQLPEGAGEVVFELETTPSEGLGVVIKLDPTGAEPRWDVIIRAERPGSYTVVLKATVYDDRKEILQVHKWTWRVLVTGSPQTETR